MEKKSKNISISVINVSRVPNLAVSICWKCPDPNWYTLYKAKKGYKTSDPQFQIGGQCVVLCYSLFQKIVQKRVSSYNDSKNPIDCITCEIHNDHFQICYNTANKLSYLKKSLKLIISDLDPSKAWKQYSVNMKNFGGKADKNEFNYVVNKLNNILKTNISILACGSVKLTSTKDGKKISEETNLNKLASYISNVFPKLKDSGKKITPKNVIHKIPDNKEHIVLKIKDNVIGIEPSLVSDYITKTLSIRTDPVGRTVIVWNKSPEAKLKSIKKIDRIKRELFSKKNINEHIVYHLLRTNRASGCNLKKFYDKKHSLDVISKSVLKNL